MQAAAVKKGLYFHSNCDCLQLHFTQFNFAVNCFFRYWDGQQNDIFLTKLKDKIEKADI